MKPTTVAAWQHLLRTWERKISIQRGALVSMVLASMPRKVLEKQARKCEAMNRGLTLFLCRCPH